MLFYAAALQTLNYDWDTLLIGALPLSSSDPRLSWPGIVKASVATGVGRVVAPVASLDGRV